MGTFFMVALVTVLGALLMMGRLNLKRFLGYPNTVDVAFTVLMFMLFHDTFSGMVVGGLTSLFMSVMLWVLRSSIGAEVLTVKRGKWNMPVGLYWKQISPKECRPHWISKVVSVGSARVTGKVAA